MEGGRYLGKTGIMWKQIWEHFGQIFGGKFVRTIALSLIQSFFPGCRVSLPAPVTLSCGEIHPPQGTSSCCCPHFPHFSNILASLFLDNSVSTRAKIHQYFSSVHLFCIFSKKNNIYPLEISSHIKRRALGPVGTISVPLGNIWLFLASKSQIFHPLL